MIKAAKIMSLALALSIFAAQTVQAEVLITPLDPKGTAESQVSQDQSGPGLADDGKGGSAQNGTGQVVNQVGPGFEDNVSEVGSGTDQKTTPEQPVIAAQSGILYDATNDRFLFEKNADEKLYPASITKLMTALLVLEHAGLNETVTFSKTAVTNLEAGAVSLGVSEGDRVSVKDCLYGLLVKSANEVANGLAEHVGGSISGFTDMMNAKAAALGCTNTHFVNANGLNDPNHYTTSRDMARIAKAAFENKTLCEIASTVSYTFPATKNTAARTITPGHKMLYSSDSRYYPGIVGGKTGYTSLAGNTLVTCAEKDGVRLIAVVLKSRSTHYADTKAMLDYGFALSKAVTASWVQNGSNWKLLFSDGTYAADGIYPVNGVEYGFDTVGNMVTGWQKFEDEWRFFEESGAMAKNGWRQDEGLWFYVGADGKIARNTVIDGTYYVGEDGVWTGQKQ